MLLSFIRKYIGSIRLFLTLITLILGSVIVIHDVWLDADVSMQAYSFLGGLVAQVIVYQVVETKGKSVVK